jgi:hypothetical protein
MAASDGRAVVPQPAGLLHSCLVRPAPIHCPTSQPRYLWAICWGRADETGKAAGMKMRSDKRELDKIYKRRDRYEIPDWQREEVWDPQRRQLLIDSILRGWRLPKFYFVLTSTNPPSYEVVDGQQRLATIFEFLSDELELSEATAKQFGGKTYKSLPVDVSDQVDDFEIDFDEIQDATDQDLRDFFQRLQSGLPLNSSEKLNAIPSKLRTFCKRQAKHAFFINHVAFSDKRYAHFDVMAKVATLEVEGLGAGLRYEDVKRVFESQANFSDQSQVAKRIRSALDFLASSIPAGAKIFRSRSITQSFITLMCDLQRSSTLGGKEKTIAFFADHFLKGLTDEVEKGREATDSDYISFQKSVNANVRSGSAIRHKILLRKLLQFDPDILDLIEDQVVASADVAGEIATLGTDIIKAIGQLNEAHAAKHGVDLFKSTNKTVLAQTALSAPIASYGDYKSLVEHLYFLFWEGPGSKLDAKPQSFMDINALRTELDHDIDHGKAKDVVKKKLHHGQIFHKYAGSASPSVASPSRFPPVQLRLLNAIKADLHGLLLQHA